MWCAVHGHSLPASLLTRMDSLGIKTYDFYLMTLSRAVKDLYSGKITEAAFVDKLSELIPQQLRRAWNEGMKENGLDPQKDMTPEWEAAFQDIAAKEFAYVDGFASDVAKAATNETPIDGLLTRAESWANRYPDVADRAKIITAPKDKLFMWRRGNTIDGCNTCVTLDGIVATAADWRALQDRGIYPKSAELDCHGDHCDCGVYETDEPLTDGGIPKV